MRIVLAGGGSGGHVTPLRAISKSLKVQAGGGLELTVISDRKFYQQTAFLFKDQKDVHLKRIYSGKFRRYNGKSLLWHLTDLPTLLSNLKDVFLIFFGIIQSVNYFLWHKPEVVFCKGGYVCVPVGIAARLFRVPLVIHDSDTHPGLTNRFLSRWALKIGTGMPPQYYQYPKEKMLYSGIPVQEGFTPLNKKEQAAAKEHLKLDPNKPLILVTGGGTGAKELNNLTVRNVETMLKKGWQIILLTGKGKAAVAQKTKQALPRDLKKDWKVEEFAEVLPLVLAADIIVSRAGATAMQEFANARKPVIVVPSPYLSGGHQLKNAAMLKENRAGVVLQEVDVKDDSDLLVRAIETLLNDSQQSTEFAETLHKKFAKPKASDEIAEVILSCVQSRSEQN